MHSINSTDLRIYLKKTARGIHQENNKNIPLSPVYNGELFKINYVNTMT